MAPSSTATSSDAATHEPLKITSKDLSPLYECFSMEDDADGNPIFLYSSFGYVSDDYTAYFGQSPLRKRELTTEELGKCLKRLPDDDVYPFIPSWPITTFPAPVPESVFFKPPRLCTAFVGTGMMPKLLLQEAELMETLLRNPHPNIIRYHGCAIRRGRIVGLVLDRYDMTLEQNVTRNLVSLSDVNVLVPQIKSAIGHLHSLGLAHNDLNPMNIMLHDNNRTLILIDFGSCRRFGEALITAGTPGWVDDDFYTSEKEHDTKALERLISWMYSIDQRGKVSS